MDLNGVGRVFRERLALAAPDRPLVIFLDALDQLGKDDAARVLAWIGGTLPPHCSIVVSITELASQPDAPGILTLEPLPRAEASKALDHWLADARRCGAFLAAHPMAAACNLRSASGSWPHSPAVGCRSI